MALAIFRRLILTIPIMLGVTFVVFGLLHLGPGDPAVIAAGGEEATPENIARARERLGLNDPMIVQYGRLMADYVQGNLGTSLFTNQSVAEVIVQRFPVTASLAVGGLLFGVVIAFPAGILAAANVGTRIDRAVIGFSTLGIASPPFFVGMVLVLLTRETIFPATGYRSVTDGFGDWLLHLFLPCLTLGVAVAAELARHVRGAMRDVLDRDYIRTARAKGVSTTKVLAKHALKNASLPVLTVLGLQFQSLLAGTIVIELVFGMQGLGSLLVRSATLRDYPMIQGMLLFIVVVVVVVNVIVDICYALLNPKVRAA